MELTGMPPARLSFSDLDIASTALALKLLEHGIGPGSRIMVQLPNIVELVVCFYAASKLGAIISPLPVQYGAHEITQLSTTLETTLFIGCPSFKGQSLIQTARDVLPRLPVLAIGDDLECLASSVPLKGTRTLAT